MKRLFLNIYSLFSLILLLSLFSSRQTFGQSLTQLGWPSSFAELYYRLDQNPEKNYVLVATLFPTKVIDFRSGNGMRDSVNHFNFHKDYHPGHQMIGWKCRVNGINHTSFTGFNGETKNQIRQMINSGWGLTSMLATYTDGYMEHPGHLENRFQELVTEFESDSKNKQFMISTVFEIAEEDCNNLVNEIHNYASHPQAPLENFSMMAKPDEYQGAVCNSFVFHLLSQISGFESLPSQVQRNLIFPDHLFGRGQNLPENVNIPDQIKALNKRKSLSLLGLIASDWSPTTAEFGKNIEMNLTDPELVIFWQKIFFQSYFDANKNSLKHERKWFKQQSRRGFWERTQSHYEPASTQTYLEIDSKFDSMTEKLSKTALEQLRGKTLSYLKIHQFPILIIEKKPTNQRSFK